MNSRWCVSDPLARSARVSPSRGGDYFILPLGEGESRRRRQGVAHTPSGASAVATLLRFSAATKGSERTYQLELVQFAQ